MLNIVLAIFIGLLTFAALYVPHLLKLGEAIVPGILAAVVAYVFLARRSFRQLEKIFTEGGQSLQSMPPRFEQAISVMQRAYALTPYQLGIRSQIDTQIGVIYFLQKEFNKAQPLLKRSLMFGHWLGGAMLAVIYYKKKDFAQMRQTMDVVVRRAKKQGLAYSLYAYLLQQINDPAAAQRILAQGVDKAPDDPRVKEALIAIQNGKKFKMRAYKEQWYQFHLEKPPVELRPSPQGGRMGRIARRGRW